MSRSRPRPISPPHRSAAEGSGKSRSKARAAPTDTASSGSGGASTEAGKSSSGGDGAGGASAGGGEVEALYRLSGLSDVGALWRTVKSKELTEAELEYRAWVKVHVFNDTLVFQFNVSNTVPEVQMERVSVAMTPSDPSAWRHVVTIAAPKILDGAPGVCYVAWARAGYGACTFDCVLRFNNREYDPAACEAVGDATPEEYPIDPVDITPADYVAPMPVADFRSAWEGLGVDGEVLESYGLPFKSVSEAVTGASPHRTPTHSAVSHTAAAYACRGPCARPR